MSSISIEEIVRILKLHEDGIASSDQLCKRYGIGSGEFNRWKSKFGGMDLPDAKKAHDLEIENARIATANRNKALRDLVEYSRDLNIISKELQQFPRHISDDDFETLRHAHISGILRRYVNGEIDAAKVLQWSNLISECEDIGVAETVRKTLRALAVSEVEMTKEYARRIIDSGE